MADVRAISPPPLVTLNVTVTFGQGRPELSVTATVGPGEIDSPGFEHDTPSGRAVRYFCPVGVSDGAPGFELAASVGR